MNWIEFIEKPWPWYVTGPLVGLMVPALLLLGNKSFGISASMRHICASCMPSGIPFFNYNWKKELWNLLFVGGIILGGYFTIQYLHTHEPVEIHEDLKMELAGYGLDENQGLIPSDLFNVSNLFTLRGFFMMIVGGFLVGFGSRYAGGCTSGHSIMGISNLQIPSIISTISFMVGGLIMANLLLPLILNL